MKSNWSIIFGFSLWLGLAFLLFPASIFELTYVQILILAAPLWLIPFVLKQAALSQSLGLILLPCTTAFAFSFLFSEGVFAAMLTIPWLVFTLYLSFQKVMQLIDNQSFEYVSLVNAFAYFFLPVGAAWAFFDRLSFQPFGFDSTIVLLTAAHFHYAGFLLLILASQVLKHSSKTVQKTISIGIISGIPLVAIGISATHFGLPIFIESIAVTLMAFSALAVGILHLRIGWRNRKYLFGWFWTLAGLTLSAGMILAFFYGWRHYFPFSFLSIPWMYAVHGTLNAMGFAAPGVLGWYLFACR